MDTAPYEDWSIENNGQTNQQTNKKTTNDDK